MIYFQAIVVALAITQVITTDLSAENIKEDILKKLANPNDTLVVQEAKDLIAEFLAQTVLEGDDSQPVPFRRDKDQPARERTRRPPRTHRPHYDYRGSTTPMAVVNNQPAVVAVPVAAAAAIPQQSQGLNPAAAVDDAQPKEGATQVPIIVGGSASAATVAAGATAAPGVTAAPTAPAATTVPTTRRTRPTVDPGHVYNQVDKILGNVATGNIVGIVDESLAIRAPTPVRNFVTGILKVIFCNPFDRLLGRCTPNASGAISSVQGG